MRSRLHAVCDGNKRRVRIALTEGQRSDDEGARVLLADLSVGNQLLADKAYDADRFGDTSAKRKNSTCIPAGAKRSHRAIHDVRLHKQRHKSENMFGRLKKCGCVAMSAVFLCTVHEAICSK